MAAHNEVNGMPCHANIELNRALREVFGFDKGLCASDAGDVSSVAKCVQHPSTQQHLPNLTFYLSATSVDFFPRIHSVSGYVFLVVVAVSP
jgi:beta-glucosidase-like glycosyl hydrolase